MLVLLLAVRVFVICIDVTVTTCMTSVTSSIDVPVNTTTAQLNQGLPTKYTVTQITSSKRHSATVRIRHQSYLNKWLQRRRQRSVVDVNSDVVGYDIAAVTSKNASRLGEKTLCGDHLTCEAGSRCLSIRPPDEFKCLCPINKHGVSCELARTTSIRYPRFDGNGYIAVTSLNSLTTPKRSRDNRAANKTIVLVLRPEGQDGLLLYNGDQQFDDMIGLWLNQGLVELSLNCGSGVGKIRTNETIRLGEWSTIRVILYDGTAMLQVNEGQQMHVRSKGVLKRLTTRQSLFIGGYKNYSDVNYRKNDELAMTHGFIGCLMSVEVNGRKLNLNRGPFVGDALFGLAIEKCCLLTHCETFGRTVVTISDVRNDECAEHLCRNVNCLNGGTCRINSPDDVTCLCPIGTVGDHCQSKIDVYLPSFSAASFMMYNNIGRQQTVSSYTDITIVFKAMSMDGLLLYNSYTGEPASDYISVALVDSFVEYRFNLGTGPVIIRSRQPVTLGQWHTIHVSRAGRTGTLALDGQTTGTVEGQSKGLFTQLTLRQQLFVGGYDDVNEITSIAGLNQSFHGCIQRIVINDRELDLINDLLLAVNIDNCNHPCVGQPCSHGSTCLPVGELYRCTCSNQPHSNAPSAAAANCVSKPVNVGYPYRYRNRRDYTQEPITVASFNGYSYLLYADSEVIRRSRGVYNDVEIALKIDKSPLSDNGLLYHISDDTRSEYFTVGLRAGFVELIYNLGSGDVVSTWSHFTLNDGLWHRISIHRAGRQCFIEVDGLYRQQCTASGHLTQLNTNNQLFIGGAKDVQQLTMNRYRSGFVGCISNVTLSNNYQVDFSLHWLNINVTQCKEDEY